jgi:hypothetical protein
MNNTHVYTLAASIGLALGTSAFAETMTKPAYDSAKKAIEADYKGSTSSCARLTANAKDVCHAEAKGRKQVALAELQAAYKPSDKARYDVRLAKANATYATAKEVCDDKAGNAKDVCRKEADAAHVAAKADATAQKKTVTAHKDAAADKRDADYAVAKEKCDSLAGTPKELCVSDAKARFGKS